MTENLPNRIINYLEPFSRELAVSDVRIGLGYTSVRLSNGNTGLAWTARSDSGSCTHMKMAGNLAGSPASQILAMLANDHNQLARSVGLAAANALVAGLPRPPQTTEDVLDIVKITAADQVVMVGYFGPVIPLLRLTGCKLDILELNTAKPGTLSDEEGKPALAACSVAIITATSIVTGTLDQLLTGLGQPRAVILLGPSTLICPPVFSGTPVTHLAGAWVRQPAEVEKIVSEGGGTMVLKKYLDFATICL